MRKKIIRDIIHGYIEIDEAEQEIIDTPNFQRLKDVKQLTSQQVYPSANHTRFEHSLGVLYLARMAFNKLKPLLAEQYNVSESDLKYLYDNLRIAALLHDIGHAPMSHLGELYYRKNEIIKNIKDTIKSDEIRIDIDFSGIDCSKHELMSCYIILKKYKDILLKQSLDLEFILRIIIGHKYNVKNKWIENIVIELINSKTIDMDKLDYIMRDSFMTGVSIPQIDIVRLFHNIYINPDKKTLTFFNNALPVIENIIEGRDSLYLWVYNHHLSVYTDFVIQFYIKHLALNFENNYDVKDKLNLDDVFSCKAVSELMASDSNLTYYLKKPLLYKDSDKISGYTKNILPQIFDRSYLKPFWKTIYGYKDFMQTNVKDAGKRIEIENSMCNNIDYRRFIAKRIIRECNIDLGDIFIVPRSNKFYSLEKNSDLFHVYIDPKNVYEKDDNARCVNDGDKNINELLPQKDYNNLYSKINFYVFCKQDKLSEIKKKFIEIIQNPIKKEDVENCKGQELLWEKEDPV